MISAIDTSYHQSLTGGWCVKDFGVRCHRSLTDGYTKSFHKTMSMHGKSAGIFIAPLIISLLFSTSYKAYAERCKYCFPERKIVRRYSSDNVKPVFSVKTKHCDRAAVEKILYILENVPDDYQKIVNDYGVEAIIFDGKLNEITELPKDLVPRGYPEWTTIDDLSGMYDPASKRIFISQSIASGCDWDENEYIALHEYGHAFHEAIIAKSRDRNKKVELQSNSTGVVNKVPYFINHVKSDLIKMTEQRSCEARYTTELRSSETKDTIDIETKIATDLLDEFMKIHRLSIKHGMDDYEKEYPKEFFAECFAQMYFSDISREKLKNKYPEAHDFFTDMEKSIISE